MFNEALFLTLKNYRAWLVFILFHVPASAAVMAVMFLYVEPREDVLADQTKTFITFGGDLVVAFSWALAQTLAFSMLARDLDKPLWKVEGAGESLRRFFGFWLLLDLANLSLLRLAIVMLNTPSQADAAGSFYFLHVMFAASIIPFGAAVMFQGSVGIPQTGAALRALFSQLPLTFLTIFIAFMSLILLSSIYAEGAIPKVAYPLLDAVDSIIDCFIFSCAFMICMRSRDQEEDPPDYDF